MNKVFKVVWSKAKCCYVVASELAKRKTKAPKSSAISRILVTGVLASICCCGAINPTYAATASDYGIVGGVEIYADGTESICIGWDSDGALYKFSNAGHVHYGLDYELYGGHTPYYFGTSFSDLVTVSHQDIYDALNVGDGLAKSDNKIIAKAGTGITVNSNGISITAGSIASGNTDAITGGTAYTELRPSDNGNYVKTAQTTAQNLNALDTQVKANATASGNAIKGLSASGTTITYTKNDGTTGTITTQDNDTKYTAGSGLSLSGTQFSVNTNGSVASGNAGVMSGGTVYSEVRPTANGTFVKTTNTTAANLTALDTASKNAIKGVSASGSTLTLTKGDGTTSTVTLADNDTKYTAGSGLTLNGTQFSVNTNGAIASGNTGVLNGGTVYSEVRPTADGNYIKKASTTAVNLKALDDKIGSAASANGTYTKTANTVNQNLKALDTQTKANTDAIAAETSAREAADNALSNRIGTLSADGNYIKKDNSAAQNLKALDDKIGSASVANGTYIKTANTVNANLKALDTQTKANTDAIAAETSAREAADNALSDKIDNAISDIIDTGLNFGANSGEDVTNKLGSKVSIVGGGTKEDSEYDNKNIKTIIVQDENGNTEIEIDLDKNPEFASILTEGNATIGGNLSVAGKSDFGDDVNIQRDLTVEGTSNLHDTNIDGKLDVTGESKFHDNVTMEKDVAVAGNTDVSGNGTFGGDLTVEGKTTLKDLLQVEGDAEFKKNASVGGDLSVTGTSNLKDTNVDGKLDVTGESAFHDNVTMDKDLSVAGNADVAGNSHVGKDLTVDGKTTLKDLLQVEGDAEFKKNASVGGDLSVTGTSNLHDTNVDGKLDVTGESAFHDNVTMDKDLSVAGNAGVDKNLTVKGKSDLQGDVAVGGKLDVAGESTFKENVSMEKDLAVAGNADVAGNGSFGGDLTVEGKTTLKDMLSVTGDAEFQSNASVGKDLTVEGTSNIHDTNIDGKLDVTGESKFHDNVTMDKSLTVSGKTTTGELEVNGNANVGGTLTADKVVANDIQLPGGSLNRRMDNMDTRIDKVGAGAAALAGLQYAEFDPGSKFSMAMGMGHYKGKTAAAVGGQYHFSKNVSMNLAGTIGNGENMVSAGLTFRFGAPRSKYQKDNNDALRAENDMLNK